MSFIVFFLSPLKSVVTDGVWRISLEEFDPAANLRPAVQLVSPHIGHDSELFDRLEIHLRVIGQQPLEGGSVRFSWTNTLNRLSPGVCAPRPCESQFGLWVREITYTTEWQGVVISDLRSGMFTENTGNMREILWEEELIDLRPELPWCPSSIA